MTYLSHDLFTLNKCGVWGMIRPLNRSVRLVYHLTVMRAVPCSNPTRVKILVNKVYKRVLTVAVVKGFHGTRRNQEIRPNETPLTTHMLRGFHVFVLYSSIFLFYSRMFSIYPVFCFYYYYFIVFCNKNTQLFQLKWSGRKIFKL